MTSNNKNNKGLDIFCISVTVLAHAAILLLVFLSYKYFNLSAQTFIYVLLAILCMFIIADVLMYLGIRYKDKTIRIIQAVLASILLLVSIGGSAAIFVINSEVNKVVENQGDEQYEVINGTFAAYNKNFKELKDIAGKKVGILLEGSVGTGSIAKELLNENNIDVATVEYPTTDKLMEAMVMGDVDVGVFPSSYRQKYSNTGEDEGESGFLQYLEDIDDFYPFEKKVVTGENTGKNFDVLSEPFNILLIGFAPENDAMTYGLADTIIVATINPQTMTVSLTSVARDSYVPIKCYGGSSDKINAARGTSRACLMETVEDLLDIDIDFYMEVNFRAVVDIVDAIGGIYIWSPVEFVGQTSAVDRGQYTVWIPQGAYWANGEEALAFARERHAMPNGDFDRQQHQKEVITEIARGLINLKDASKALKVMEAAGNNISTNLSLNQLTGIFNLIVNMKNYTTLSNFDVLDIQSSRVTGYASWTYSYSMRLPIWIYKLYNGSISEARDHIVDTLGDFSNVDQIPGVKFFSYNSYVRAPFYSDYFNEKQEHDELPPYYPYLTKYTYDQALAWAASNGVTLQVTFICEGEPGYRDSDFGYVVAQEPRQGALVSEWPVGKITVMGDMSGSVELVPNFVGASYRDAVSWANNNGYSYDINWVSNNDISLGGKVIEQTPPANKRASSFSSMTIKVYEYPKAKVAELVAGMTGSQLQSWINNNLLVRPTYVYEDTNNESLDGSLISYYTADSEPTAVSQFEFKVYRYVRPTATVSASVSGNGSVSGTGAYPIGDSVTITAVPGNCSIFVQWSDGETSPSRTFTLEGDVSFSAIFADDTVSEGCAVTIEDPEEIEVE